MKIDFVNLNRAYQIDKLEFDKAIQKVLSSSQFIMGKDITDLEINLSNFVHTKYTISCSSGTDALLLALMSMGIGQGDEVIVPSFSFIATAEVVALAGARPVFVDISSKDFNIDVSKIESAITPKTKAIMPVSLYGQMANMLQINDIAKQYHIDVIEDAAQSFGAMFQSQKSCAMSRVSCTSFFPSKPFGCFGDGGAAFTDDEALANKMKSIRVHGQTSRYVHKYIGINGRLDNLQAAILNVKIKNYEKDIAKRQSLSNYYETNIHNSKIIKPQLKKDYTSAWAQYTVRIDSNLRDGFQKNLFQANIPTAIHYPRPLHLQECFKSLNYREGMFPISEQISKEVISLPMNSYFSEEEKQYIVSTINDF